MQDIEPTCFILREGTVSLYRTSDNLLISSLKGPSIIGMNTLSDEDEGDEIQYNVQGIGVFQYEIVSRHIFQTAIEDHKLWSSLARHYIYVTKRLAENYLKNVGVSTYQQIKNCLISLESEDISMRLTMNACKYIQETTQLSRSAVMKTLSKLKKEGILIWIEGI